MQKQIKNFTCSCFNNLYKAEIESTDSFEAAKKFIKEYVVPHSSVHLGSKLKTDVTVLEHETNKTYKIPILASIIVDHNFQNFS